MRDSPSKQFVLAPADGYIIFLFFSMFQSFEKTLQTTAMDVWNAFLLCINIFAMYIRHHYTPQGLFSMSIFIKTCFPICDASQSVHHPNCSFLIFLAILSELTNQMTEKSNDKFWAIICLKLCYQLIDLKIFDNPRLRSIRSVCAIRLSFRFSFFY